MNPYHIDPNTLRIFLVAARHLNLTKAALEVHMTLSAVSKRIADLEQQTSCILFLRKARGLELTAAGKVLVEHAQQVLFDIHKLSADMRAFANGEKGTVRLWANTSSIIQFLPEDLANFSALHPDIKINLEEKHSHETVSALNQELIDIGIFANQVPAEKIQQIPYRQDKLVLLTPIHHPLATHQQLYFREALAYDFVGLSVGSSLNQLLQEDDIESSVRFRVQVSSFDAICRMVAIGLGISVLPIQAIAEGMIGTSLHIIELKDSWAVRTLWLGINKTRRLPPEALKLFEFLKGTTLPKQ